MYFRQNTMLIMETTFRRGVEAAGRPKQDPVHSPTTPESSTLVGSGMTDKHISCIPLEHFIVRNS